MPEAKHTTANKGIRLLLLSALLCFLAAAAYMYHQRFTADADNSRQTAAVSEQPDPALVQQAEHGDAQAQFLVGRFYMHRNRWAQAVPWYERAASQGHAKAQNNLGVAYREGLGVNQDADKGCRLMVEAAAKINDQQSWENAALCHDTVWRDYEQAFSIYRRLAGQGNVRAMRTLGQMYQEGEGIEQNNRLAAHWLRQAVMQNDVQAMYVLGLMYGRKQGVADAGGRNLLAAYLLLKMAQLQPQSDEDRQKLAEVHFEKNLADTEAKMPAYLSPLRVALEQRLANSNGQEILAKIDGLVPYQAPQTIP